MHSIRMHTARGVSASVQTGIPPLGVGLETPSWCGPGDPPHVGLETPPLDVGMETPLGVGLETPRPDPLTFPLGVGLKTCNAFSDTTLPCGQKHAMHAGIPPP